MLDTFFLAFTKTMDMRVKINERNHKFASFKLFNLDYSLQTFFMQTIVFYLQMPFDNLLGKGWPLSSLVCVSLCFCHFPIWCLRSGVVHVCIDSWPLPSSLMFERWRLQWLLTTVTSRSCVSLSNSTCFSIQTTLVNLHRWQPRWCKQLWRHWDIFYYPV